MASRHDKSALLRAKKAAGGNSGLGRLLGISSQAVSQWERIPADRVLDVERATGVSRHELRPDIYQGPASNRPYEGRPSIQPADRRDRHFSKFGHLRRTHFASGGEIDEHIRALREEWDRR